jgi:hypothetical protein
VCYILVKKSVIVTGSEEQETTCHIHEELSGETKEIPAAYPLSFFWAGNETPTS